MKLFRYVRNTLTMSSSSIMNIVDGFKDKIPDGDYLKICNLLMEKNKTEDEYIQVRLRGVCTWNKVYIDQFNMIENRISQRCTTTTEFIKLKWLEPLKTYFDDNRMFNLDDEIKEFLKKISKKTHEFCFKEFKTKLIIIYECEYCKGCNGDEDEDEKKERCECKELKKVDGALSNTSITLYNTIEKI